MCEFETIFNKSKLSCWIGSRLSNYSVSNLEILLVEDTIADAIGHTDFPGLGILGRHSLGTDGQDTNRFQGCNNFLWGQLLNRLLTFTESYIFLSTIITFLPFFALTTKSFFLKHATTSWLVSEVSFLLVMRFGDFLQAGSYHTPRSRSF